MNPSKENQEQRPFQQGAPQNQGGIRPFARILGFNETFTGLPEIRAPRASNTAEVTTIHLSRWPLLRDSAYYTLSISALIVFIYDEKVVWWEALTLILMYFVYILIMKMNSHVVHFLERRKKNSSSLRNGAASNAELDDGCDATAVLLKKANHHRKPSVLMVDELLSAYPHQLSFSEAGMRIMITSHFSPRTRLTMASRMLITERNDNGSSQTLLQY
ncbi:unnamed protein product [Pleuronectes platessa]|uniref:Uncharacterized protein n=1 Tax=Pleuronectes platessa TaxID=8262 RepID=A0A9N7V3F6_PLEPL|nr:unnamed protein product [Pleuronectes platessa]